MPQIPNLKLLFSPTNPSSSSSSLFRFSFSKPFFPTPHKRLSILTLTSASRRAPPSRTNTTLTDNINMKKKEKEKEEVVVQEEEAATLFGFNKRRAEGKDKNDKPKTLHRKVQKLNPINTLSYVQILGTGMDTQDTSPSVLLFFDKQRFIFNAGEGLQRYCTEHRIKLSKIDHIFLSRVCSETAGGLPGLLLTLAGMGDEGISVNVWGPSDLKYLVDAMRSFIPKAAMVHTHSFGPASDTDGPSLSDLGNATEPIVLIDDEVVKISAVLIRPNYSMPSEDSSILITSSEGLGEKKDPMKTEGSTLKPGDISVIYVCELPEIKGKFDPAKAKDLGLRPGPKYRELQLGNSVKSDMQNIMIHPSDVLGPSIPGPIVLLVDCPTVSHFQELLSIQSLSSYYVDSLNPNPDAKSVNCIVHLSPSSVATAASYQNWMKKFGEVQHIMAGHEIKNIEIPILQSSAKYSARLNYLCPQFFPAPGFWSLQHLSNLKSDSNEGSAPKLCDSIYAENLLKFHLRPYAQLGLDKSGIPSLTSSTTVVNELLAEIPEIADSVEQVKQLWNGSAEAERTIPRTQESTILMEEPWMSGDDDSVPNINSDEKYTGASEEGTSSSCVDFPPSCLDNITREDMEIVLLGTGSSQPSKYRNVTSIYVNLFSKGSLLLDCGEGSLGQLKRRFGVKGADEAIRSLSCIWISHIHADHHTGLARVLSLRRELLKGVPHEPILVIGPGQLKRFLDAYQRLEDLDMEFLDCRKTTAASIASFENNLESGGNHSPPGGPVVEKNKIKRVGVDDVAQDIETGLFAKGSRMQSYWKRPSSPIDSTASFRILKNLKKVLEEAGLESLVSIPVVHCPQAYGIVVKAAERTNKVGKTIPGWKLVYSGDTRPCPALIDASHGATVLIHEATFENGMAAEAIARNHSTTKEAIEVGDSCGAYRIILTHFSQRYPKIPVFDESHMHKTCIAFDLMSVNIADLPVLPNILPHFKLLFRNEMMVEEDEEEDFVDPVS